GIARVTAPLVADPNQPVPERVTEFAAASSAPPAVPPSMDRAAIKALAERAGFTVHDAPVEAKDSPSAFAVIAADEGATDPRDRGDRGPMVLSAADLPVVKKRPIVPVDAGLPIPKT